MNWKAWIVLTIIANGCFILSPASAQDFEELEEIRDGADSEELDNFLQGRAASVGHQQMAAGTQRPQGPPIPPFFLNMPGGPNQDTLSIVPDPPRRPEDELCDLIHRLIKLYAVDSTTSTCPSGPSRCDYRNFPDCQCTTPAKYSKEGFGNCNFGSSRADKRVWCYVDRKKGDPRQVCPDAIASVSEPGWFWSRMACLT